MAGKPTEERGGARQTTETLAEPGKGPRPVVIAPRAPPGPDELSEMAEGLGLTERFEVVGPLGRGGMGVVLEARDLRLGRDVAIKVLSGARLYDGVARARFEREARAAARLSDPTIVTVHELASSGDYMVMELVRGESLKERLERGPLPAAEVRRLGAALCRALSVAHAAGVIHRDVKPSNVLIDGADRIRLADFGIATFTDAELTVTGVMIGTPAYMAPEQLRGGAVDARSDLYAVGATLFEAATGRMLNDPADPCRDPASAVAAATGDRALAAAIERAAAERPADRFGAAEELAAALAEASGDPRARRRRRWALAAAAAAGLTLAAGAWLAWPRGGEAPAAPARFARDQTLVVLPFENRSLDRSLTFAADGLADNLQLELGGQEAFQLVARARLARELPDGVTGGAAALAAARRAGASWAVRGSIGDQAGGLVMVTIDLVDTGPGHHAVNLVSEPVPPSALVAEVRAAAEPIVALLAGDGAAGKERQMELGRKALVEDRIPEAVRHYSTVLLRDPADPDALTARAFAAWWNALTPEPTLAAIDAALAAPLEPRHREFLAAFRLLVDVRYPDAILAFERLAAARPREFEVLYGLFEAQFHGGRPVDAAATFDRLRQLEPRIVVGLMHPLHRAVVRPDTPGLEWARAEMGNGVRNRGSLVRWLLAERDYLGAEQVLAQVEKGMVVRAADFDIAEIQLALATERYQAIEAPLARLAESRPVAHLTGRIGLAWARGDQAALARWTSPQALALLDHPADAGDLAELATLAAALPGAELRRRVAAALDRAAGWQRRALSHQVARALLAAATGDGGARPAAPSPYPEAEAVKRALAAEAAGDPRAAAAAWRQAADSTLEGRFLVVEEAGVARNLEAAGDRRAAAEACDRVIEPRAFQWAWAAEVGPCLERRAAAGDRVAARRLAALRRR